MFRPHYDRHLINTLLGRNQRKAAPTDEDMYMLDRPYMNAVDLEILPRLAPTTSKLSTSSYSARGHSPSPSPSPISPVSSARTYIGSGRFKPKDEEEEPVYLPDRNVNGIAPASLCDMIDTEALLRLKWMDNTPRMSRLRETRRRRLVNKLEQYELWDQEQEQKNRQHELAREQRYKNIVDRLKSHDFCVNQMKKRHENDLETTRELENYSNDHLYFDCLDDPKTFYKGPVSQYREFSNEMEEKVKTLLNDLDTLNPRQKINQAILPRIERTREIYSIEPEIFTRSGRRVLKRPKLDSHRQSSEKTATSSSSRRSTSGEALDRVALDSAPTIFSNPTSASEKFLSESQRRLRNILNDSNKTSSRIGESGSGKQLKPIIVNTDDATRSLGKLKLSNSASSSSNNDSEQLDGPTSDKKAVYFSDNVDYRSPPSLNDDDLIKD